MGIGPGRVHGGVLLQLLVFLAAVFALAALAWMLFLPSFVATQVTARTGCATRVDRLVVNPFTGAVDAHGFVLANPPGFPAGDFVEVREFRANVAMGSLLSDQIVFDAMTLDLPVVTVVTAADGTTNAEEAERGGAVAAGAKKPSPVLIHRLKLRVGRVVVIDQRRQPAERRELKLDLDQSYTEVSSLEQLFAPEVRTALAPAAEALGGLLPREAGRSLGEAAKNGTEFLKETGRKAEEKAKGFFRTLEESRKP